MTFKEYFKLTRGTTNNCIKICGVIFTSIYAVIALITGYRNNTFSVSIEIFLICFLLGNGLGLFIWFLAITTAHGQVKAIIKFYNSIPKEIKDKFGLSLFAKPQNPEYNFLQFEISDTKSKQPYLFNFNKKYVWIAIINDLSTIENIQKLKIEIQKKYKKEHIVMTGWGLQKKVKSKEWEKITIEKVDLILEELKTISNKENLTIINRD